MFKYTLFLWLISCSMVYADINAEEYCHAIYITEGADLAHTPFGIESVSCNDYYDCKQVCMNTVNNNINRYNSERRHYENYLDFLSQRYCPPNHEVWERNTRWIIRSNNRSEKEINCWSDDLNAPIEWDEYINSSYERLMRNESNPHLELSWLREHFPDVVKHKSRLIYNCLRR